MAGPGFGADPARSSYDVVIVGGAIMGSATAWFLTKTPGFDGSVLVIERDPSYAACSTAHTNSCIRQQFSTELNIRISQFTAAFLRDLRGQMDDLRVPDLDIQSFGYLYLASTEAGAGILRANREVQAAAGVPTRLLTPEQIAGEFPFYDLADIVLASHNTQDEGYWDGGTVFDWFRRSARARGVEYVAGEVAGMELNRAGTRVEAVTLASGHRLACGHVVNATGPRAARTAAMAGIRDLPVEPRKRYSWVFTAERPLERELPLTIDPSGIHVRQDGPTTYLAGAKGDPDPAVDPDDFAMDHWLWEGHVWPHLAARIPQFEAIRVVNEWAGHYAYNTLDQNAVLGPHPEVANFLFINGFSGHGLQQSPAMGRGLAEWITHGEYRALDLTPFSFQRLRENRPFIERAVI